MELNHRLEYKAVATDTEPASGNLPMPSAAHLPLTRATRGELICGWLVVVAAVIGCQARAEELTLAAAERQALRDEPGVLALTERAAAARELAIAARALPDPQLRFGALNLPLEGGGFRTEGMTQLQIGVRQTLPPATGRAAANRRETAFGERGNQQANDHRQAVLLAVRTAWLNVLLAIDGRQLVSQSRPLFENLVEVTRSRYTVGDKNQQDLLRAELQLGLLDARVVAIEQREAQARAELRRWLGADADRPLAPGLPNWPPPPPLRDALSALTKHPALAAAAAAVAAADAAVDLAQSRFRPGWTLDAAYGYRDGGLPDGSPRPDVLSVSASLNVPLFTANRQHRGLRAAQARRRAAMAERDELRLRLASQLRSAHGRWDDLGRRLALYGTVVLPQARAHADAALAAYRSETADFDDVMRSHISELETRLDHLGLRAEQARSHAELAYFAGLAL